MDHPALCHGNVLEQPKGDPVSKVFDIHVLPAQRGDSLWIEYGPAASPHHIIIDGGITKTGREHLKDRLLALGDRVRRANQCADKCERAPCSGNFPHRSTAREP